MTLNECPHCYKSLDVCSRCGEVLVGWEDGWPNHGVIDLGLASQAFGALGGAANVALDGHFKWWKEGHEAMTVNDAQHVRFEWTHETSYKLCYRCQKELLKVVGHFFGIDKRARELGEVESLKVNA